MGRAVAVDNDDDDVEVELAEHKPLRQEAQLMPSSPPAEFALVGWASCAFVFIVLATMAALGALFSVQIKLIVSSNKNALLAEKCMLLLAESKFEPSCYVKVKSVTEVNTLFRNRWIHFAGESFSRDAFYGLKALQFGLHEAPMMRGDHSDQMYRSGSSLTTFAWAPFLSDIVKTDLPKNRGVFSRPDYVYIAVGLHDILYRNEGLEPDTSKFISKLSKLTGETRLVMLELPPVIDRAKLPPAKADVAHFNNEYITNWIESLTANIKDLNLKVLVLSRLQMEPFQDQDDGIHSRMKISQSTNRIAQIIHWLEFPETSRPFSSIVFSLAIFGIVVSGIVVWFQIRAAFFSVCSAESIATYCNSAPKLFRVTTRVAFISQPSVFQKVATSCAILFVIMAAVYLADGPNPVVPVSHKSKNNAVFAVLYIATLLVAMFYRRRVPANLTGDKTVLNRLQTEEWKGMMQVAFIWYHLFDAAATYNLIRVFVTSYVWMTGFGNFLFFQTKQDFSFLRIVKTLFRLNFLVALLCVILEREWMLYYICPLHTIYFLFVWLVARCPPSQRSTRAGICKAVFSIAVLLPIFFVPDLFESLFSKFGGLFLRNGSLWEWRFRAQLDAFSSSLGILCACALPSAVNFLNNSDRRKRFNVAAVAAFVLLGWLAFFYPMQKTVYNKIHPYIGFLPMLSYIVLRNVFPRIRETYMPVFQFIGTVTLETYLLQLHLYMSHDAKMVIMYLPENHLLNFVLSTSLYVAASYAVFRATASINDFLFPSFPWSEILLRRILPVVGLISGGALLDSMLKVSLQPNYLLI